MNYDNPFPGMNPYLERSSIWPGFHFLLVVMLAEQAGPLLPDNYRIELGTRHEIAEPFGTPPDLPSKDAAAIPVRMPREVRVTWLRVEAAPSRRVVTIIEVLSPTNKAPGEGRRRYIRKREAILAAGVNLVEIDLLRRWEPMPLETPPPASDYRILICRAWQRPDALLYPFTVRQPIPQFPLPLLPDDPEPEVNLGPIIDGMHHTARYTQVAAYENPPPEPDFPPATRQWIAEQVAAHQYAPQ